MRTACRITDNPYGCFESVYIFDRLKTLQFYSRGPTKLDPSALLPEFSTFESSSHVRLINHKSYLLATFTKFYSLDKPLLRTYIIMAEEPDLTLPERVPEMEQYRKKPMELLPFAFYALCNLDAEQMEACRRLCATGIDDDTIKLPPRAHFQGQPLRSIVKYHVELGAGGEFDRKYLIFVVYPDSHTVILVTLDDSDLECKPDLFWENIDQSGTTLVNLQIANTDWFEAKQNSSGGPQIRPPTGTDEDQ